MPPKSREFLFGFKNIAVSIKSNSPRVSKLMLVGKLKKFPIRIPVIKQSVSFTEIYCYNIAIVSD